VFFRFVSTRLLPPPSRLVMKPMLFATWLGLATTLLATCHAQAQQRPNVLVIMVDDLGYSDIGCYGGEIETPQLDALAADGLRFSQFYNTAKCHSSRVSLLTGQYCIAAGDASLSHAVTSAEVLGGADYFTAMAGKWHLRQQPTDFGFARYFGHLSGACNYFLGDKTFRLNGQPWEVPRAGFYTTVANVDHAIGFLGEARQTKKPWYLYVAFNAPHAPLQALPEDYAKYEGRYDQGWEAVRDARIAKQQQLGIIGDRGKPSPRPEHVPAWETLSPKRQAFEVKRMTTLAAMIDRVDQEIGRLVEDLKAAGEWDNTLIWFVSDNGACPYDRRSTSIEALPTDGSVNWSDSTGWAWARNSPFRYYKQNQFEGGISTPVIVHWPAGLKTLPGSITHQPAHLIDVLPTLADVTSSKIPATFAGRDLRPVSGQSLRPVFAGERLSRTQPIHLLFGNDRGLRDGDWKAVSFRGEAWELYDLATDRSETVNLADQHPERLQKMIRQWHAMGRDMLHASERTLAPARPAKLPHRHPEWTDFRVDPGANSRNRGGKPKPGDRSGIRARKNTTLQVRGGELQLKFSGDDPGIAIDRLPSSLPPGPYELRFELRSEATGNGELFFTTDSETSLPRGTHKAFEVTADNQWHSHVLSLATTKSLQKIRLDVSESAGQATIRQIRLTNPQGDTLAAWPGN